MVWTKRGGKRLVSRVVAGTPEHRIAGHERLECAACHSRTVLQYYGCHTQYDEGNRGWDFIQGRETDGEFSETEDHRRVSPESETGWPRAWTRSSEKREQRDLVASIREPVESMPRFGLDAAQAEALVAYLLRTDAREAPQDT